MKLTLKRLFVLGLLLCSFFVIPGCINPNNEKDEFIASNYDFDKTWIYKETLNFAQAVEVLTNANQKMAAVKAYSYQIGASDIYNENNYEYSGEAKIDLTKETPLVFMEFTGDIEFKFYISDNIVYLGHGNNKFSFPTTDDLSNLVDILGVEIDLEMKETFASSLLTSTSFKEAGIVNDEATIIKFEIEQKITTIVIYDEKIAVIMTQGSSLNMRYVYDYSVPVITLPEDLSEYVNLE